VAIGFTLAKREHQNRPVAPTRQRYFGLILAISGWLLVLFLTLYPTPDQADTAAGTSMWCLVCGELGMVDVLLNVVLFLPLGLGLGLARTPWLRAILIIGLTTLSVEILQLSVVTGRDASLSDLLTNSLGGAIGLVLARHWERAVFPSPRVSLVLAAVGAAAWLAVQGFTAFALQRSLPFSVYYGQWAPELAQFERFTGQVRSVRLDTIPLGSTRLARSDRVRETLLVPETVLLVTAASGRPTEDVAPIFSIFDDRQREILLLGQKGDDLVFRVRTRTGSLGLRSPALRLPDALAVRPGTGMELRAQYRTGHYRLDADIGGASYRRDLALSASWGWTFLLPFDHAFGGEMPWLTMLWVSGLVVPLGYYASRSGVLRPGIALVLLPGLLAAGLVLIPALAGFDLWHPLEWVAGLAGGLGGLRLGRARKPLATD
jgi:hypothetical protein